VPSINHCIAVDIPFSKDSLKVISTCAKRFASFSASNIFESNKPRSAFNLSISASVGSAPNLVFSLNKICALLRSICNSVIFCSFLL